MNLTTPAQYTKADLDVPDPVSSFQMTPPAKAQSFVQPSATPAWEAQLTGQNKTAEGVTGQFAQEIQRQKDTARFKQLLDQGDKLADMIKQDAVQKYPDKLSSGRGVDAYLPPKELFVDQKGNFDGFNYSKHALVGIAHFEDDLRLEKQQQVQASQFAQNQLIKQQGLGLREEEIKQRADAATLNAQYRQWETGIQAARENDMIRAQTLSALDREIATKSDDLRQLADQEEKSKVDNSGIKKPKETWIDNSKEVANLQGYIDALEPQAEVLRGILYKRVGAQPAGKSATTRPPLGSFVR